MRKRADTEEGEEVVTAWRVVKRRMAKGDCGGKGRRETDGEGRNGIRVEGRLRECQRGLRGDERGWGDERVADHAEVGRLAFSLAIVSSSSSRFLRFPVFSSSLFLFPISFYPCYHVLSLPRSLAIVLFGARGVFRGKRPSLVDGPSHGLQLSPNPSHFPVTPYPSAFLSPVSLPFSVLISLFLPRSPNAADSLFAPRSHRVFFATLHTLRGGKEAERKKEERRTKPRRRDREGLCHPMY